MVQVVRQCTRSSRLLLLATKLTLNCHSTKRTAGERDGLYHKFSPYAEEIMSSQHPYSVFRVGRDGRASGVSVSLDAVRAGCPRGQGVRYTDEVGGGGQERTMIPVVLDAAHTPPAVFHQQVGVNGSGRALRRGRGRINCGLEHKYTEHTLSHAANYPVRGEVHPRGDTERTVRSDHR